MYERTYGIETGFNHYSKTSEKNGNSSSDKMRKNTWTNCKKELQLKQHSKLNKPLAFS